MNCSLSVSVLAVGSLLTAAALAPVKARAAQTINWLSMSPVGFNATVPNNSNYNLPGVGMVNITYTLPAIFTQSRFTFLPYTNGNISAGAFNWTAYEFLGVVNSFSANAAAEWRVTYSFPSPQAANTIFVGISGLGRRSDNGGTMTVARVNQNGTFLGDWVSGGNYGPSQYTGGSGFFTMINSLSGPRGVDPWWNSELGVVRINDAVSSLTVIFNQLPGDGVGVNIGFAPAAFGACAIADVASDSLDSVRNPNGFIGPDDLDAFIAGFIAGNAAIADVASDSLDTVYNPNGFVGAEDLDAFIASFIAGC